MQAGPAATRYVSVSELYSTDEVELLLDEIRELEPTSCRGEDVQDFEIAGSGCSGVETGGGSGGHGGRSPAGTEVSWDSHAVYRAHSGPAPAPLAPVYLARSVRGALAAAVAAGAAACAACTAAGGGRRPAARPLLLAALLAALTHGTLAALHVTRLHRIMPLPWPVIGAAAALGSLLALTVGGSLLLHHVATETRAGGARRELYAAAVALAYASAAAAALYAWRALHAWRAPARGAYRAVPPAPPPPRPAL